MDRHTLIMPALSFGLVALLAACAPQPSATAVAPTPASFSAAGNARTTGSMPAMAGMNHSNMQGMDMNAMMSHCTDMRRQTRPGTAMSADMRQTMAQCDEMDRSMGMTAPRSR